VVKVNSDRPDKKAIAAAARILKRGGLVAFPTETVYGVGARVFDGKAVSRLRGIKKRPEGRPFTAHISDMRQMKMLKAEISAIPARLMKRFWPGPLTIVLRTNTGEKVGTRMPENKTARDVIAAAGSPLAVPSANISGKKPPVCAEDVLRQLDGKIDMLLDGGPADIGVESTVLDTTVFPYKVLRKGAVSKRQISIAAGGIEIK